MAVSRSITSGLVRYPAPAKTLCMLLVMAGRERAKYLLRRQPNSTPLCSVRKYWPGTSCHTRRAGAIRPAGRRKNDAAVSLCRCNQAIQDRIRATSREDTLQAICAGTVASAAPLKAKPRSRRRCARPSHSGVSASRGRRSRVVSGTKQQARLISE